MFPLVRSLSPNERKALMESGHSKNINIKKVASLGPLRRSFRRVAVVLAPFEIARRPRFPKGAGKNRHRVGRVSIAARAPARD